jgi:signal transduction histidine kinase
VNSDLWTASAIAVLFLLVTVGLVVALWWRNEVCPGFERWSAATSLFSIAILAFSLKPITIVWMFVISPAIVASLVLALEGCREFRRLPPALPSAYFAGTLTVVAGGYFEAMHNPDARIVVMSAFCAYIGIHCSLIILKDIPEGLGLGSTFTGALFAVFTLASIARGAYVIAAPRPSFFTANWSGNDWTLTQSLLLMSAFIGWLVMTNEVRLEELKHEKVRAEAFGQEASAAGSAQIELLAMIGHEVRNPLSGVIATVDLLLETDLTEEQREYAVTVSTSIEALAKVTDDILDLSRIESGQLKIEPAAFDPCRLIESIVRVSEPLAAAKGLSLTIAYDHGIPSRLVGDAGRIRQVVTNLLSNALKFTTEGQVRISAAYEPATDKPVTGPGQLRIQVKDTGMGIAPENITTIFQKGGRAHAATSEVYGGSGIGLATSKKLAQLMGGRLEVKSAPGQGSRFVFTVPLVPVQRNAAHT